MKIHQTICLTLLCSGCAPSANNPAISVTPSNTPVQETSENPQIPPTESNTPSENAVDENTLAPETSKSEVDEQSKDIKQTDNPQIEAMDAEQPTTDSYVVDPSNSGWFTPAPSRSWYIQTENYANREYLSKYFKHIKYSMPQNSYALIAPLRNNGTLQMRYFSYKNTAFEFSMTESGEEKYWPASTVKLAAAVMALLKLSEYGVGSKTTITMEDAEGSCEDTVEHLSREAIIPSNNTAYNRLMEIAGFDQINDYFLPEVFHFPKMILQRRYVRIHPDDGLRISPEMTYTEGNISGVIPKRVSAGKIRPECPRESNCTTLAELAEVMFRVVMHNELSKERQLSLKDDDIQMLRTALKEAPSCIGEGVASVMGKDAIIYNKGGKVIGDDRLEVAVVSSPDGKERYLLALSMPYYEGVETETNALAAHLIEAMRAYKEP